MAGSKVCSGDDMVLPNPTSSPIKSIAVDDGLLRGGRSLHPAPFTIGDEAHTGSSRHIIDNVSPFRYHFYQTSCQHRQQAGNPDFYTVVCSDRYGNVYSEESYEGAKELLRIKAVEAYDERCKTTMEYAQRFKHEARPGESCLDFINRLEQHDKRTLIMDTHDKNPSPDFSLSTQVPIEAETMQPTSQEGSFNFLAAFNQEKQRIAMSSETPATPVSQSVIDDEQNPSLSTATTRTPITGSPIESVAWQTDVVFDMYASAMALFQKTRSTGSTVSMPPSCSDNTPVDRQITPEDPSVEQTEAMTKSLTDQEELFFDHSSAPVKVSLPASRHTGSPIDSGYGSGSDVRQLSQLRRKRRTFAAQVVRPSTPTRSPTGLTSGSSGMSTPEVDPQQVSRRCLDHYHASASRLNNQLKERDLEVQALQAKLREKDEKIGELESKLTTFEVSGCYIGEVGVTNEYHDTYVKNREETLEAEKQEELQDLQKAHQKKLSTTTSVLNRRFEGCRKKLKHAEGEIDTLLRENRELEFNNSSLEQQVREVEQANLNLSQQLANPTRQNPTPNADQSRLVDLERENSRLSELTVVQDAEIQRQQEWINARVAMTGAQSLVCNGTPGCICAACHLATVVFLRNAVAREMGEKMDLRQTVTRMEAQLAELFHGAHFGGCANTDDCRCITCVQTSIRETIQQRNQQLAQTQTELDQARQLVHDLRHRYYEVQGQIQGQIQPLQAHLLTMQAQLQTAVTERDEQIERVERLARAAESDQAAYKHIEQQAQDWRDKYNGAHNENLRICAELETGVESKQAEELSVQEEAETIGVLTTQLARMRRYVDRELHSRTEGSDDDLVRQLVNHVQAMTKDDEDLIQRVDATHTVATEQCQKHMEAEKQRCAARKGELEAQTKLDDIETVNKWPEAELNGIHLEHAGCKETLATVLPENEFLRGRYDGQQKLVDLAMQYALAPDIATESSSPPSPSTHELLEQARTVIRTEGAKFAEAYNRDKAQRAEIAELTHQLQAFDAMVEPLATHWGSWQATEANLRDRIHTLEEQVMDLGGRPRDWMVQFAPTVMPAKVDGDAVRGALLAMWEEWGKKEKSKGKARGGEA